MLYKSDNKSMEGADTLLVKLYKNKAVRKNITCVTILILIFYFVNVQAFADDNVIEEIKSILNNYYIEDLSEDILNKDSAKGIINSLKDPYTQIIDRDYYSNMVDNTFIGIGVAIEMIPIGSKISSIMVNSPAMKAGLKEGDIIITVNDNYLNGLTANDALKVLNGAKGDLNELQVLRNNEMIFINVIPDTVYYPTVYSRVINGRIAYINILFFGVNTLDEFEYEINSLNKQLVDSYIIDLRNNPGGYIYSAVELSGYFAKSSIVATAQFKNGARFDFKATEKNKNINKPTIFLVNKYTASAAELMAACAQDYGSAVIIGEKTYGKGVAQSTFTLSDGNILKTTTLKLYSPKGREINNVGIFPDIIIKDVDTVKVGELFVENVSKLPISNRIAKIIINSKSYYINLDKIVDKDYLEIYRQIISQSISIDVSNDSELNRVNKTISMNYPVLKYAEVPKTDYELGDRVIFKFVAPTYNGLVQYRAMLWNETTNKYVDLWNTKDRYYDKWKPRGRDIFTISFPALNTGNYKIKVFVKRNGIENSKTTLIGMNCDSYVYEIPFKIGVKY